VGGWLYITPLSGTTPATPIVWVDTTKAAAGTNIGSIAIDAPGFARLTVAVTLNAGTSTSPLTAEPASLAFTSAGGATPTGQNITVGSTAGALGFSVQFATQSGNWLTAGPTSGTAPGATVSVAVNPAGLADGTYNGSVTLTPTGGIGSALVVPVSFTVGGTAQLSLSAASLTFYYQLAAAPLPASQTVDVSSSGVPVGFTRSVSTANGVNWLSASPASGTTPGALTISINSAELSVLTPGNTYTGSVTVSPTGVSGGTPQTVQVSLVVSTTPLLAPAPASLSFTHQPGTALPPAQNLAVSSTSAVLLFGAGGSTTTPGVNWLSVSPSSGTTPATLSIGLNANAQSLPPGEYTGSVGVTAVGFGGATLSVPVKLTVSSTASLVLNSPNPLPLNYQLGRGIPIQMISIDSSSGAPVSFAAQPASTGNWLAISSSAGVTPASLQIGINAAAVAALVKGTYDGTITFSAAGGTGVPAQTLNVVLTVSDTPLMNVSKSALAFSASAGQSPGFLTQDIEITSTGTSATDPILNFSAVASTVPPGGSWLLLAPNSGAISINPASPTRLSVYVNSPGLAAGKHTGSVTVTATTMGGTVVNSHTIPVTVTVAAGALTVDTTPIAFTQSQGGPAPAAKTVSVGSNPASANLAFTVTQNVASGGNWLEVTPSSGTTPATLTIKASGSGLSQGTYTATVSISSTGAANSPQVIPVTLTVGAPQTLAATPATFSFSHQVGSAAPAAQKLSVSSTGGNLNFTATASTSSGANWLKVDPANGTAPRDLNVTVTPGTLAAGTYTGTITIASAAATNTPQVPVTLTITPAPLPTPVVAGVANAASWVPGAVAPGEIVTLGGTNIGPKELVKLRLNPAGRLETLLERTIVLFDGVPAPLIYVSETQTSAIVPYWLAGRFSTRLQVEYQGVRSAAVDFHVTETAPGIFTQNSSGSGLGAILNQNGTVNSSSNPERKGSIIQIFATGEGVVSPVPADGSLTPLTQPFPQPLQHVSVTIGGRPAEVDYRGAAPGAVAGLFQVNARIPNDVPSGLVPVTITVGGATSQPNVVVAVQ
jgi:uncharacterized protein (TIGR03437 family)